MKLQGKVERVSVQTRYGAKASEWEVASVSCSLEGHAACTFDVPLTEAEHWSLGMPVTVTVEKGEPDEDPHS